MLWDVVIIGGGAAGLWAAGTAAARGKRTLVLEKNNKAGVKILMSGGTRCNITHHCDPAGILEAFGSQGRFLRPAVHELPPAAVVAEIERLGVPTKVEDSGKVFPCSDRALDVRDALVRRLDVAGAEMRCGASVRRLTKSESGKWRIDLEQSTELADRVILCTGGLSYSACGTTGDGYQWAEQVGHTLQKTYPALTPLVSPVQWAHQLSGLTLPDVSVTVHSPELTRRDPRHGYRGSFLWTHFGCSGPAPMNVSRFVSSLEVPHRASLLVDLLPNVDHNKLEQMLSATNAGRQSVTTLVCGLIPKRLAQLLLERAGVSEDCRLAELPRKARLTLAEDLKRLSVPLSGTRGYGKAEVTMGGVTTSEVDPRSMESRASPGLFLAGEVLDVDGPIGGFNFQAAFATGHLAGLHV